MLFPVGLYKSYGVADPTEDPSDGLTAAAGSTPSFYARALGQSSGTVSPLVARIGTDSSATGGDPTYNASGIDSSPSVDYVAADNDYHDVTSGASIAAVSADPKAPITVGAVVRFTSEDAGYLFGFGDPSAGNSIVGLYYQAGILYVVMKRSSGTNDVFVGGTVPVDTDMSIVFTGNGTNYRLTYHPIGGSETEAVASTAYPAVSAGNYSITTLRIGASPRNASLFPRDFRMAKFAVIGAGLTPSETTAVHTVLQAL